MNGQCPGDGTLSAINAQRGFIGNGDPYSFDLGRLALRDAQLGAVGI